MNQKSLTSMQGLGPKIYNKLINHFVTEENAIKAISEGRISEIASIKGIGKKLALKIIQEYNPEFKKLYSNQFLKTNDAINIYEKIIEIIKLYAQTQFIKDKFSLMFPLPASKYDIIQDRLNYYREGVSELNKCNEELLSRVRNLLKRIKPINPIDFKKIIKLERLIITDNQEEYKKLINNKIAQYAKILLVKSFDELDISYYNSFDIVILITNNRLDDKFLNNIDNLIILNSNWNKTDLIPELILSNFLGPNYELIITSYKLIKILYNVLKTSPFFIKKFSKFSIEELESYINDLELIDKNCNIKTGYFPEYDKYKEILDNFDAIITETEYWINETIENKLKSSKTVIEGNKILNLLQSIDESKSVSIDNLLEILPINLNSIIQDTITQACNILIKKLYLDDPNSSIVFDIFSDNFSYPIETDEFIVNKLKNKIWKKTKFIEFQILVKITKKLNNLLIQINEIIKTLFELDELLAIKYLIKDYNLHYPNFINNKIGLSIKSAYNIFLLHNNTETIPINYHFGSIDKIFDVNENIDQNIIILTGANSGGKTTLLQTISQIIIMAQMGLPVPAIANIGAFEELYYFSKSQGELSSGAFETSIKQFTDAIVSNKQKIVLMDELEAITEPGAAAKVICSILEMFHIKNNACVILVSHLAEQILKIINIPFRIDGIEALGIDNTGKLIVDRNPKFNYFAKSMPFFIIKKLYTQTSDETKKQIYEKMISYFTEYQ